MREIIVNDFEDYEELKVLVSHFKYFPPTDTWSSDMDFYGYYDIDFQLDDLNTDIEDYEELRRRVISVLEAEDKFVEDDRFDEDYNRVFD